jgi:hypothetical protein
MNNPTVGLKALNWICFFIGMVGVWIVTESWYALFFAWIASLHFNVRIKGAA